MQLQNNDKNVSEGLTALGHAQGKIVGWLNRETFDSDFAASELNLNKNTIYL